MAELATLNDSQRLYVIAHTGYVTCLGYDVAERKRRAVRAWINPAAANDCVAEPGTLEHFAEYQAAMVDGAAHNRATGKRCPAELVAELVGYEGKRVEVTTPDNETTRFWVGRSTGWMPCHLEIARRNSSGGPPVYFPAGARVRLVAEAGSRR